MGHTRVLFIAQDVAHGSPSDPGAVPEGAIAFFDEDGNQIDPAADSIVGSERVTAVRGLSGNDALTYTFNSADIVKRRRENRVASQDQIVAVGYNGSSGSISTNDTGDASIKLVWLNATAEEGGRGDAYSWPFKNYHLNINIEDGDGQTEVQDKIYDALQARIDNNTLPFVDSITKLDDTTNFGVQINANSGEIFEVFLDEKLDGTTVSYEDGNAQRWNPGQGNGAQVLKFEEDRLGYTGVSNRVYLPLNYTTYTDTGTNYDQFIIELESDHTHRSGTLARATSPNLFSIFYPTGGTNIGDVDGPVISN